jgi:multicomponent Na+:H+ antiporter subunit C
MTDSSHILYLLAGAALFTMGLRVIYSKAALLHRIIAINVMGNGVFLVLITLAARTPGGQADPVPHALVLTGIVVSVCAVGLALTLADRYRKKSTDRQEDADL